MPVLTEVDEQLSGRNLDFAIAERVMGWVRGPRWGNGNGEWIIDGKGYRQGSKSWDHTPRFSASIEAAMEVVEKLTGQYCRVLTDQGGDRLPCVEVKRLSSDGWIFVARVEAESLPLAICRAALKAVGAE